MPTPSPLVLLLHRNDSYISHIDTRMRIRMYLSHNIICTDSYIASWVVYNEELPGLHPVISVYRDSIAWRNNCVRGSPKWLKSEQTNHSVAFSLSSFPKTLCPIFPILCSLQRQLLPSAHPKKSHWAFVKRTIRYTTVNSPEQSDLSFLIRRPKCCDLESLKALRRPKCREPGFRQPKQGKLHI